MLPRVSSKGTLLLLVLLVAVFASPALAQVYNVNAAFLDNEKPDGTEVNPFGQFAYGYSVNPSNPAAFSIANLQHTNAFAGTANIEGYFISNNVIVPAIVQNTSNATITPGYAPGSILPGELMLHPGNATPGGDGFASPVADAILRFTAVVTGDYNIVGNFRSQNSGIVDSRVLHNGLVIADVNDGGAFFIPSIQLNAGDFIDFAVDDFDGIGSDSTGLTATISLQPEPTAIATWAACAVVALAIGWRFRGRKP